MLSNGIDVWGRTCILEALIGIHDLSSREEFVHFIQNDGANDLFVPGGDDRSRIICLLAGISHLKRVDVVRYAPVFLTEGMNEYVRFDIISAFKDLPDSTNMEDVVTLAPILFTEDMNEYDRADIISALADIERRREFVTFIQNGGANALFIKGMNAYNRVRIICALGKIPDASTRADVAKYAPALFSEDMDGNSCSLIIRELAKIHDSVTMENVVSQALPSFTEGMGRDERFRIVAGLVEKRISFS